MSAPVHGKRRILKCRKGATAIEYGLIVAAIALGILAYVTLTGQSLSSLFESIGAAIPTDSIVAS